jgi:hypothetical protein
MLGQEFFDTVIRKHLNSMADYTLQTFIVLEKNVKLEIIIETFLFGIGAIF